MRSFHSFSFRVFSVVMVLAVLGCTPERFQPKPYQSPLAELPAKSTTAESPASWTPSQKGGPDKPRSEIVRGTRQFVAPAASEEERGPEGDVSLTFVNADVREASKAILGDMLGLRYSVLSSVQGTVTVETSHPIRRDEVLPTFETALKSVQLGLVERDGEVVVVPLAEAQRSPGLVGRDDIGTGTEAVPLRFVNANALKKLLDPVVPERSMVQADASRNVVLISGSTEERRSMREMIRQFDVNWLKGMSFALITTRWADSSKLIGDLEQIVNAEGSPMAGMVRLSPVARLNGVLAISSEPEYLEQVRQWVERLDRESEDGERRLFIYRVQNGRASNLAAVLGGVFAGTGGGQKAQAGSAPFSPTASTTPSQRNNALSSSLGADNARTPTTVGTATAGNIGGTLGSTGSTPGGVLAAGEQPSSQQIQLAEGRAPISVTSDDVNNAIVVYASAREYASIEQALKRLDVMPLQVLIEAVITEVSLNDSLRYGVQWYFQAGDSKFNLSNGTKGLPDQVFPGFSYLLSKGDSIRTVLNALDQVTDINVVSSPQLMVLNNQTAMLQVGDQVPIKTQSSQSTATSSAPVINSIELHDTGVILKVTPRVNDSGLVLLDISQEVSEVVATSTSTIDSPTIRQRRFSSSVAVADGQTVALGGLIRDDVSKTEGGVPMLKDVPVLGNLFSATDNSRKRTELLVLLTPRVVRNSGDAQAITDELRRTMVGLAPLTVQTASPTSVPSPSASVSSSSQTGVKAAPIQAQTLAPPTPSPLVQSPQTP